MKLPIKETFCNINEDVILTVFVASVTPPNEQNDSLPVTHDLSINVFMLLASL